MLISWLVGVGFGLFFSGIILSILLYTSNKAESVQVEAEEQTQTVEPEEPEESTDEDIEVDQDNAQEPDIATIELEIEPSATAKEITRMLVDHKVISDYDEFIAYIVSKDAERTLSHGKKIFPLESDVETVFKILRPY